VAGTAATKPALYDRTDSSASVGAPFASSPRFGHHGAGPTVVTSDSFPGIAGHHVGHRNDGATLSSNCLPARVPKASSPSPTVRSNLVGNNYTLTAYDEPLPAVTSTPISVHLDRPAQLAFTTSPTSGTAGVAFATQPVVAVEDAGGNVRPERLVQL